MRKQTPVFLAKREAEAVMDALDRLFEDYPGGPGCPKCAKALWKAIHKIDAAFGMNIFEQEACDE
jgi:hypothetical protein